MLSDKELCKMVGCKESEWCFGEVDECADAGFMKVAAKAQEKSTQIEERKRLGRWLRLPCSEAHSSVYPGQARFTCYGCMKALKEDLMRGEELK